MEKSACPDEVDCILANEDGRMERSRDPRVCRHNKYQKCTNCLSIDPYDEEYLHSRDIKHMSFHAYVRKLTDGKGKGTHVKAPLENMLCHLQIGCTDHKPYPMGICSRCRPPMVTLNRQRFRHVDNISFENEQLVERFLDFWRRSGHQRLGFLLGRYQVFQEVPLGIKAVVAAIYEPPQCSERNRVQLEEDANESKVDELCRLLQLKRIGWIFSDLWAADSTKGTVHCTRHEESFLLSAEECITAASFQNKYPNVTRYSTVGFYGSKFVTVVASGDRSEHIHFSGYQVSNQCSALVKADILLPTNHPELAYIRKQPVNSWQFITDVQFVEKDEYGHEVSRDGRPFAVEYLLVDVPVGMPRQPQFTFHLSHGHLFPVENRSLIGHIQDLTTLAAHYHQFSRDQFLEFASDFHVLLYLYTLDTVPFSLDLLNSLCTAVKNRDRSAAIDWAENSAKWQSLKKLLDSPEHVDVESVLANKSSSAKVSGNWPCAHCTFDNPEDVNDCSICGLPKSLQNNIV